MLTAFNASGFLGQCIFLIVAKKLGKRSVFFSALLLQCAGGVATAFAPNAVCFAVFRCIVGLSVPAILISPATLAYELTSWKVHMKISLLCSTVQSLGTALLAGIVLFVGDWSNIALATSTPFLVFFLYGWVFPESPRFLVSSGRYEETGRLLRNIANTNGSGLSPDYVVSLKRRFRVELALQADKQRDTGGHTLCDLLSTANMRKKIILLIFIASMSSTACLGLSYYSVFIPTDLSTQLSFALCSGAEVAAAIIAAMVLQCGGRRCAAFLFAAFSGIVCLLQAFSAPYVGWEMAYILYVAAKFFSHVFGVILPLWTREQLPVVTREKGFYLIDTISLLGPIGVPFIVHQGEEYPFVPMGVFGCLLLTCAVMSLGLPDTRHLKNLQTLHDAELFGKYWKWKDYFTAGPKKTDHKNGILKSLERKPHSPILGLLRKRDSFHLANAKGEIEVLECNFDSSTPEEPTVKVTVL